LPLATGVPVASQNCGLIQGSRAAGIRSTSEGQMGLEKLSYRTLDVIIYAGIALMLLGLVLYLWR